MSPRKRSRTAGEGEEEGEAVPVAGGFEAPIFCARVVGQVTTLALEGEDGPLASLLRAVASDRAGGWYVTTKEGSLLHVSAAGRSRTVATCEDCRRPGIALSPDGSALFWADNGNHKILRVEVATGAVTMLAGSGEQGDADGVGDAAVQRPIRRHHQPRRRRAVCGGLQQPQDPAGGGGDWRGDDCRGQRRRRQR